MANLFKELSVGKQDAQMTPRALKTPTVNQGEMDTNTIHQHIGLLQRKSFGTLILAF